MTVIVAVSSNGKVTMGGDAAGSNGTTMRVRPDPKVFINGEFLIGYTSSFRMGQLLQYDFSPPQRLADECGMSYMVRRFIPAVRELLKNGGYARTESNQESGGTFLVGWRGEIYQIESDFQVARSTYGYDAVGCGEDYALGSLHATEGCDPKIRCLQAMKASEAFSAGVRGPYTILEL